MLLQKIGGCWFFTVTFLASRAISSEVEHVKEVETKSEKQVFQKLEEDKKEDKKESSKFKQLTEEKVVLDVSKEDGSRLLVSYTQGNNKINYYRVIFQGDKKDQSGYIAVIITPSVLHESDWLKNLKNDYLEYSEDNFARYIKLNAIERNLKDKDKYKNFESGAFADAFYYTTDLDSQDKSSHKVAFISNIAKVYKKNAPKVDGEAAYFLQLNLLEAIGVSKAYLNATVPFNSSIAPLSEVGGDIAARIAYYLYQKIGAEIILKYRSLEEKSLLMAKAGKIINAFSPAKKCNYRKGFYKYLENYFAPEMVPTQELMDYESCAIQMIYQETPELKQKAILAMLKGAPRFYWLDMTTYEKLSQLFKDSMTHHIDLSQWDQRKQEIDYEAKMQSWGLLN
jgi:hypothetical protein